jgi:hypothetical protein
MPGSFTTSTTSPPQTVAVNPPNGESSGTITGIACGGPCEATLYNAAGTALINIRNRQAFSMPVSIAFAGGVLSCAQKTQSGITFTFA